jgi:hypothetical protein
MLTAERLREVLSYDPETGVFTRRVKTAQRVKVGDIAGTIRKKDGRRVIMVDGKNYLASLLAHLYMTGEWPKNLVDHRDLDRLNDRWENLRPATRSQNEMNKRPRGKLGVKGVTQIPSGNYQVRIRVDGRQITLGSAHNLALAGYMYAIAAAGYHGEFARTA